MRPRGRSRRRRPDASSTSGSPARAGSRRRRIVLGSEAVYCDLDEALAGRLATRERIEPDAELLRRRPARASRRAVSPDRHDRAGRRRDRSRRRGDGGLRRPARGAAAGVPALELRAISNDPDEADRAKWQFAEALAALAGATERLLAALASA